MAQFSAVIDLSTLNGTNGFRLDGIDPSDLSGFSVSSAGDVNGDGFDDIIIGARFADPGGNSSAGESYVVFGKAAGFATALDLATLDGTNGFRLDGIDASDFSGRSVSSAGDVNGDGFDDVIIGARFADPGGNSSAGESYLVFGKAAGFATALDLATLDGTNGFRLDGIDAGDYSGHSVSSAGDVNGDGFDDIIIGAFSADPGGDGVAGESYVVFGKTSGFAASLDLDTLDGTNGFRLDGIDVQDASGRSVSSAGDVNGDGFDDIIIGAYRADPGGDSAAGESYVVFGKAAGYATSLDLDTLDGANGFRLDGIDAYDQSGRSVSSAGDVNGDGFDDIIIGARDAAPNGNAQAGESYVVFGKASGFAASLDLATLDGSSGFRLDGITAQDRSGFSVSSAGDVNGDGFDDIIIGARYADPGGDSNSGESYVLFGKASGFAASLDLATLDGTNGFRLDGIDAYDQSGRSVSSAGDVNGDGFDDIIIGAYFGDPGGDSSAGESYVVFGVKETTIALNLTGAAGDQTMRGGTLGDTISGLGGDDALFGDAGNDRLYGGNGDDSQYGGDGDDRLRGNDGIDELHGDAGADMLFGGDGNDVLNGGTEVDYLYGDAGDDTLNGDGGNDRLNGGDGNDTLYGGAGDDKLKGKAGNDELHGGDGSDQLLAFEGLDTLYGDAGDDWLYGGFDADILYGGDDADRLRGNFHNDELHGGAGDDRLFGGAQNDTLFGDAGNDFLYGENGKDTLDGGTGNDKLYGASDGSIDTFVFAAGYAIDNVRLFEDIFDVIDLSAFSFPDKATAMALASQTTWGAVKFDFGAGDVLYVEDMVLNTDFTDADIII